MGEEDAIMWHEYFKEGLPGDEIFFAKINGWE